MPYLLPNKRSDVAVFIRKGAELPGELNYQLTQVINFYLANGIGISYTKINDVVGALECAKLEVYRRIAAPYEDKKCKENGDVYAPSIMTPEAKTDAAR